MRHIDSVRLGSVLAMAAPVLGSGLAHAADQSGQPNTGREITLTGHILHVRPAQNQITLQTTEGRELELNLDQGSQVRLHQHPATLSEVEQGTRVHVTYEPAGGRNRVLSLRSAPVTAEEVQQELRNRAGRCQELYVPTETGIPEAAGARAARPG